MTKAAAPKIRLGRLDMTAAIEGEQEYLARLAKLQLKMLSIQQTYYHEGRRAIVVVEGWDAAGKGGFIRRLTERLDPRGFRVWPIGPPDPQDQARFYLYRFWTRLPEPGTIAIFDRSWYGRVLVERVEGLIDRPVWRRAYDEINAFEAMLAADGVRIVKLFLHITPEEQLRRFQERLDNPYKRWKLTEADLRSHNLWDDYVAAAEEMFERTSTGAGAWTAIAANHKWHARLAAIERVSAVLGQGFKLAPPPIDPRVRAEAMALIDRQRARPHLRRRG